MYSGLVCPKYIPFLDSQQNFLGVSKHSHKTKTHHKPGKVEFHTSLRQLVGHLLSTITLIKNVLTTGEGEKYFGSFAEFPGVV